MGMIGVDTAPPAVVLLARFGAVEELCHSLGFGCEVAGRGNLQENLYFRGTDEGRPPVVVGRCGGQDDVWAMLVIQKPVQRSIKHRGDRDEVVGTLEFCDERVGRRLGKDVHYQCDRENDGHAFCPTLVPVDQADDEPDVESGEKNREARIGDVFSRRTAGDDR